MTFKLDSNKKVRAHQPDPEATHLPRQKETLNVVEINLSRWCQTTPVTEQVGMWSQIDSSAWQAQVKLHKPAQSFETGKKARQRRRLWVVGGVGVSPTKIGLGQGRPFEALKDLVADMAL